MARTSKVEVEIVATDEASPKIDRLEQKIDGLESDEARVTITSNIERFEKQLDAAQKGLDGLDGDEATVQLRLIGSIEKDLADARRLFDSLDGKTGVVRFKEVGLGNIKDALRDVTEEAGAIGGPLGTALSSLGATGPVVAGVAAIGAGLFAAADAAADLAENVDTTRRLTGDTAEDTSRMIAVWKAGGGDVKDFQDVLGQMADVLGTNTELTEQLGINLKDGATGGERFRQVLALLDQIPDATTRMRVAAQLFGEEGVRQVNSMTAAVGDYGQALEDVPDGAVMSEADIERAREMQAEMRELSAEFQAFATAIGSVVIPVLSSLIGSLNDTFDAATNLGHGIRGFFDDKAAENWEAVEVFENSKQAARDFDRTLLDGLTTFDEVHAAVLEHTGDLTAANMVAVEWSKSQKTLTVNLDGTTGAIKKQVPLIQQLAELTRDYIERLETQRQKQLDMAEAAVQSAIDWQTAAHTVSVGLQEIADSQDQIEADALSDVFDVGDKALDTLGAVQGINAEIRDFAQWLAALGRTPNIFDIGDPDADEFLSKLRGLREPIQDEIERTFGESGPAAAEALADSFVETISKQTGLSESDVRNLLNIPEEFSVLIKPVVDKTDEAIARRMLEALGMLPGQSLDALAIEIELDAGRITPQQARAIAEERFRELKIEIPTTLKMPSTAETDRLVREAEAALGGNPVRVPVQLVGGPFAGAGLGGGFLTPEMFTQPQPTQQVNVTNNFPPGTPDSVVGAVSIFTSRNGVAR